MLRRIGDAIYSVQNPNRIRELDNRKDSQKKEQLNKRNKKKKDRKNSQEGRLDTIA